MFVYIINIIRKYIFFFLIVQFNINCLQTKHGNLTFNRNQLYKIIEIKKTILNAKKYLIKISLLDLYVIETYL